MKALILAAGKGTRLQDLTRNCPKPMLPVQGKPLLEHIVHWLAQQGITEIAMNLHHCPDAITDHFADGSAFNVAITYSYEATLLGTAGAAKRLAGFLNESFVVVYGDVFTNLNLTRLMAAHQHHRRVESATLATLALYRVPNPSECGLVEMDSAGRVTRFVEKPPSDQIFTDLANAGIMVCEPEVLEFIPEETSFDFGRDVFPALLAAGKTMWGQAIAEGEYLIDIGTPMAFTRAQQLTRNRENGNLSDTVVESVQVGNLHR
ncbi:MAG: nucleotidyltransferase family protein [Caldilineaceae bacterium]